MMKYLALISTLIISTILHAEQHDLTNEEIEIMRSSYESIIEKLETQLKSQIKELQQQRYRLSNISDNVLEEYGLYRVKVGDNLFGISRKFDIQINMLISINEIVDIEELKVGMLLFIKPFTENTQQVDSGNG